MPGRITDELKRITREQHGGGVDTSAAAPASVKGGRARGRYGPLIAAVLLAVLVGGGWWLVQKMQADSKLQDCVMSGRKNCTPSGVETAP
jgi:hypothetical protein